MARKTSRLEVRLTEQQRQALREMAEREERPETWFVERGLALILADPTLTPETVADLRAEIARLRRALERATRTQQQEWLERVRQRQEERRARSRRWL